MIFNKKKMLTGILSGAVLLSVSFGSPMVQAAPADNDMGAPPAMSEADLDNMAEEIATQYGVDQEEVRTALGEEHFMDDIYYAAMLAKISGKPFSTVLSMKVDWIDVMRELGVTREMWDSVLKDMVAEDIAARSSLSKDVVSKLMEEHYIPRDIRTAGRLAEASGKDVYEILGMKKTDTTWIDVAKELKVDPKVIKPRTPDEEQEDLEAEAKG